jgi:putative membrane protein
VNAPTTPPGPSVDGNRDRIPDVLEDAPDAARRAHTHPAGNFLRGMIMGSADLVPGVSGGTMALVTGIYERLVASVRGFTGLPVRLVRGDLAAVRRDVEWLLLLPVLLGMGTAIVLGAGIIPPLLEEHPERMYALFMGMIVASLPIPWRMIERHGRREYALVATGAILAYVLAGLPSSGNADPALLVVFGAAAIAICAMVLPGVSGSYLLLVLGMYEVTLAAVDERNLVYIAVFALGALAGLAVFTRLLSWLLAHHHAATMAALVGLMVGSLRALWPWQVADERTLLAPTGSTAELAQAAGFFVVGLVVVTALARIADRRHRDGAA